MKTLCQRISAQLARRMKRQIVRCLVLLIISSATSAHAGVEPASVDDVADDLVKDGKVRVLVFDDRDDRVDGVRARVDGNGRIVVVPRREMPEPRGALTILSNALKRFAATSGHRHGDKIAAVVDAIDVVARGDKPFPEALCVGGQGRLVQMLDDQLALERAPADSDAARAKRALQDVCAQLPKYWDKFDTEASDPLLSTTLVDIPDVAVPLCPSQLRVVVPGLPGEAELFKIEGYMLNGKSAVLEEGQRLTAVGCPDYRIRDAAGTKFKFGLDVTIKFRDKTGNQTVAFYVKGDSAVHVPLPANMLFFADQIGSSHGTLAWQALRTKCIGDSCGDAREGWPRALGAIEAGRARIDVPGRVQIQPICHQRSQRRESGVRVVRQQSHRGDRGRRRRECRLQSICARAGGCAVEREPGR